MGLLEYNIGSAGGMTVVSLKIWSDCILKEVEGRRTVALGCGFWLRFMALSTLCLTKMEARPVLQLYNLGFEEEDPCVLEEVGAMDSTSNVPDGIDELHS